MKLSKLRRFLERESEWWLRKNFTQVQFFFPSGVCNQWVWHLGDLILAENPVMTMPVAIFDSDHESTEDWLDKVGFCLFPIPNPDWLWDSWAAPFRNPSFKKKNTLLPRQSTVWAASRGSWCWAWRTGRTRRTSPTSDSSTQTACEQTAGQHHLPKQWKTTKF